MWMLGAELLAWPITSLFLMPIVRPNLLQACAKQLINLWSASSVCVTRAGSSAKRTPLMVTCLTLVLARSLARLNSLPSDRVSQGPRSRGARGHVPA